MTQATLSVARLVPDGERMNFLPKAFGSRLMLRGEISVYNWLDRLSQEYSGGFWHYYEIPNGFYMAPADYETCLLYTSPSPRDVEEYRMPSSA